MYAGSIVPFRSAGSTTLSTGKSCEKSTPLVPRKYPETPSVLLLPSGLSSPSVAVESCASNSKLSLSVASHFRLKPTELFSALVA